MIDRIIRGEDRAANLAVLEDLCNTMKFGSLCALGGFTPYPVMSALTHFPEDFGAAAASRRPRNKEDAMSLVHEIDYGTPRVQGGEDGHADHRRQPVTVPEGTSIMRAAMEMGTKIPKLCATDMLDAFGSCRLCLVEIEGRAGTPASCTTPVAPGMVVHTQTERLKRLRKGVMELYISDHPLDCLTCAANGDCELQDMAGAVGLREVRYGYERTVRQAASPIRRRQGRVEPVFHLRSGQVHRLLALRARLRGGAGHIRADDRRPRLRQSVSPGMEETSSTPNASPAAPACRPARPRR